MLRVMRTVGFGNSDLTFPAAFSRDGSILGNASSRGSLSGYKGGVYVSHDFENGGFGPYSYPWTQYPDDVVVVDDPTGRTGKVAWMHYVRSSLGASKDVNRALFWARVVGYGQTIFFKGDFYIPHMTPGTEYNNRKLVYFFGGPGADSFGVVGVWGTGMRFEGGAYNHTITVNNIFQINWDQWYTLEIEVGVNSAYNVQDGVIRVWVDGTQVLQRTNMWWLVYDGSYYLQNVGFGYQTQEDGLYDEVRYWDNVSFAPSR